MARRKAHKAHNHALRAADPNHEKDKNDKKEEEKKKKDCECCKWKCQTVEEVDEQLRFHFGDKLKKHWQDFMLSNINDMNLGKLVKFWSWPQNVPHTYNKKQITFDVMNIYYIAFQSAQVQKSPVHYAMARVLTLFGAFMMQLYRSSIQEIQKIYREIGNDEKQMEKKLIFYYWGHSNVGSSEQIKQFIDQYLPADYYKNLFSEVKFRKEYPNFLADWYLKPSKVMNPPLANSNNPALCQEVGTSSKKESDDPEIELIIRDLQDDDERKIKIRTSTTLKSLFATYSDERNVSLRTLRFKHDGKTLFLSSINQQTPAQLGLKNLSTIEVVHADSSSEKADDTADFPKLLNKRLTPIQKYQRTKNAKEKKTKTHVAVPEDDDPKVLHSENLSKLFREAEPKFKLIRQHLNSLNLERTDPKTKRRSKKENSIQPVDNPISSFHDVGGKAGKSQFVVQVGEVQNLYKSTKPSAAARRSSQSSNQLSVDLHGMTKEEALCKLDESLVEWNDIAMKGMYPFVVTAVIVCGGGAQILSETVEGWIRQNRNVANAPKNLL